MKILIPNDCIISEKSIIELKKVVKYLIQNYETKYSKYKIYLYPNYLKVNYKKHNYTLTILEYNCELFWYMKPFDNSYFLLKYTSVNSLSYILSLL